MPDPRVYEAHYEALRAQMIGAAASTRGVGLALILQEGLPAWMRAVGTCVAASVSSASSAPSRVFADREVRASRSDEVSFASRPHADRLAPVQRAEVARLLACLVLSRPGRPSAIVQEQPI